MKSNILYILLFLFPITIKSMLTQDFVEQHLSESEDSGSKRNRAKSMIFELDDVDVETGNSSSTDSELSVTVEVDALYLLEVYFGNKHTGEEPYCGAVKDSLIYCRDNSNREFKELARFLECIKDKKNNEDAFHKDFLHNNRYKNAQALLHKIVQGAIVPIIEKKKLKVAMSKRTCRITTGVCVGSFLLWCGVILAAVIPAAVQC
jgi:hypothetical protein